MNKARPMLQYYVNTATSARNGREKSHSQLTLTPEKPTIDSSLLTELNIYYGMTCDTYTDRKTLLTAECRISI